MPRMPIANQQLPAFPDPSAGVMRPVQQAPHLVQPGPMQPPPSPMQVLESTIRCLKQKNFHLEERNSFLLVQNPVRPTGDLGVFVQKTLERELRKHNQRIANQQTHIGEMQVNVERMSKEMFSARELAGVLQVQLTEATFRLHFYEDNNMLEQMNRMHTQLYKYQHQSQNWVEIISVLSTGSVDTIKIAQEFMMEYDVIIKEMEAYDKVKTETIVEQRRQLRKLYRHDDDLRAMCRRVSEMEMENKNLNATMQDEARRSQRLVKQAEDARKQVGNLEAMLNSERLGAQATKENLDRANAMKVELSRMLDATRAELESARKEIKAEKVNSEEELNTTRKKYRKEIADLKAHNEKEIRRELTAQAQKKDKRLADLTQKKDKELAELQQRLNIDKKAYSDKFESTIAEQQKQEEEAFKTIITLMKNDIEKKSAQIELLQAAIKGRDEENQCLLVGIKERDAQVVLFKASLDDRPLVITDSRLQDTITRQSMQIKAYQSVVESQNLQAQMSWHDLFDSKDPDASQHRLTGSEAKQVTSNMCVMQIADDLKAMSETHQAQSMKQEKLMNIRCKELAAARDELRAQGMMIGGQAREIYELRKEIVVQKPLVDEKKKLEERVHELTELHKPLVDEKKKLEERVHELTELHKSSVRAGVYVTDQLSMAQRELEVLRGTTSPALAFTSLMRDIQSKVDAAQTMATWMEDQQILLRMDKMELALDGVDKALEALNYVPHAVHKMTTATWMEDQQILLRMDKMELALDGVDKALEALNYVPKHMSEKEHAVHKMVLQKTKQQRDDLQRQLDTTITNMGLLGKQHDDALIELGGVRGFLLNGKLQGVNKPFEIVRAPRTRRTHAQMRYRYQFHYIQPFLTDSDNQDNSRNKWMVYYLEDQDELRQMREAIEAQHTAKGFPPPFQMTLSADAKGNDVIHFCINLWNSTEYLQHLMDIALGEAQIIDAELFEQAKAAFQLGIPSRTPEEKEERKRRLVAALSRKTSSLSE